MGRLEPLHLQNLGDLITRRKIAAIAAALIGVLGTASVAAAPPNSLRILQEAVVEFVSPPPPPPPALVVDAAHSTVVASVGSLETGQSVDVTVTLRTSNDVVVPGKHVVLEASSATSSISPAEDVSDSAGKSTFVASDSVSESVTFIAFVLEDDVVIPPPPPSNADLFIATSGSDSNSCAAGAACATLNRAIQVSQAGDVIEIGAGSYPDQVVAARNNGNPDDVIVRPAAGANVLIGDLSTRASHITYRDLVVAEDAVIINSAPSVPGADDVTFDGLTADILFVFGRVSNITVTGSSFGPEINGHPMIAAYNSYDGGYPSSVTLRGNTFHDFTRNGQAVHTECLQILAGTNITMDSNRFTNCDGTGDAAVSNDMGPTSNVTFVNNWFDSKGDSGFAMQISALVAGVKLLNNSSAGWPFLVNNNCTGCGMSFVGNYAPFHSSTCKAGVTSSRNVWQGGACNSSDLSVSGLNFVNAAGFDLHLASGANAIDRGDPGNFPSADIDGEVRPHGAGPDAGADES